MSRYDATQTNESQRSSRIYKDLNLDFQKNTATKIIKVITWRDVPLYRVSLSNILNLKLSVFGGAEAFINSHNFDHERKKGRLYKDAPYRFIYYLNGGE